MSGPRHAIIGLTTPNLGDDLQAMTIAMQAPSVSALVHRERLSAPQVRSPHTLVMNYWFMSKGWRRAPHTTIDPIFHGFCVGRDEMLKDAWADYLRAHAPIGCRDTRSVEVLGEIGIDAYWSGCATLFLGRMVEPVPQNARKGVLLVDVAPEAEHLIPAALRERAERITNITPDAILNDPIARWHAIARICDRLRHAELVVTRRLHTALPCAGFGTPVVLCVHDKASDVRRFSGYDSFIPLIIHDNGSLVRGIDWSKVQASVIPPELSSHYEALKSKLRARFGPLPESRAPSLAKTCRFRFPNPGLGVKAGEVEIDLGVAKVRRQPAAWSDRFIDLEIDAFPGFERFDVPVSARGARPRRSWMPAKLTPLGRLNAFSV